MKKVLLLIFAITFTIACGNYTPDISLWNAAKKGDLKAINYYIKKGDINKLDKDGNSALWIACYNKRVKVVKALLKNGALAKEKQPILSAIIINSSTDNVYRDIAIELINHGANVNEKVTLPIGELTPLLTALTVANNPKIAKLLLEKGADPNQKGLLKKEEIYPLEEAFKNDDIEMIKTLVLHGADFLRKYPMGTKGTEAEVLGGFTPLEMAVLAGKEDLVKFLLDNGAFHKKMKVVDVMTLTFLATQSNNETIIKEISKRVSPNGDENYIAKQVQQAKEEFEKENKK